MNKTSWGNHVYCENNFSLQQFPYPQYHEDIFLQIVAVILPLFLTLTFLYSAGVFVKVHVIITWQYCDIVVQELVLEKESRIRETMKMMGLSNWILWTTWFTKQLLFYLVPLIIMSILLKVGLSVYVKLIFHLFTVWACVSV